MCHDLEALTEVMSVSEKRLARFLTGVQLRFGIRAELEVQMCGMQVLAQHYWCGHYLQRAGHGALADGGSRRCPQGTLPLVDFQTHGGGNLGRLDEGVVDVLRSNQAGDIVDVGQGSAPFVWGRGKGVELLNYG